MCYLKPNKIINCWFGARTQLLHEGYSGPTLVLMTCSYINVMELTFFNVTIYIKLYEHLGDSRLQLKENKTQTLP